MSEESKEPKVGEEKAAAVEPTPITPATPHPTAGGLAIAAMIVGIVAVLSGWALFFGFIAGVVAIVLAIIALKKKQNKGFAITGLVTGIVAVVWNAIVTILFLIAILIGAAGAASVGAAVNEAQNQTQSQVDAKKDFAKGETAVFGDIQIKINSVNTNFTPESEWAKPEAGNKFISLNVTIKNISNTTQYVSGYNYDVNVNGLAVSPSYHNGTEPLESGDLSPGASTTGDIVYEVPSDATALKLQYKTTVFDLSSDTGTRELVYTLAF